jgi:acetolactate synthase I/II/III large subunit
MNGAECIVKTLMLGGVDVCFANPGTSEMALVAALDRAPGMKCILGLFEGVVTGAADGYARMALKPAATLLHCGPGLANGLANLHNAKRAGTPIINIVGDQATYHRPFDPPLAADVEAIARPFSHWVVTALSAPTIGRDTALAIEAANSSPRKVATLIVPADVAWAEGASLRTIPTASPPALVSDAAVKRAVEILRAGEPSALLLAGDATLETGLKHVGQIVAGTGARALVQMFNTRISRGRHLPAIERIPYNLDQALSTLAGLKHLILIGANAPVAFFAYPDRPSCLVPEECQITVLASENEDAASALELVANEVGAKSHASEKSRPFPTPATGALTPDAIAQSLGALIPEGAIVTDESLTSGRNLFALTSSAAPHELLQHTGGAIGIGIPLATGAAVACPDRRVICLQADGSGMYTLQGLWTQAREGLNVTTVIYANRAYAILKQELANLGIKEPGRSALDMMDLGRPDLNWVRLAEGMGVEAERVSTMEAFNDVFRASLDRRGPFLIEVAIAGV